MTDDEIEIDWSQILEADEIEIDWEQILRDSDEVDEAEIDWEQILREGDEAETPGWEPADQAFEVREAARPKTILEMSREELFEHCYRSIGLKRGYCRTEDEIEVYMRGCREVAERTNYCIFSLIKHLRGVPRKYLGHFMLSKEDDPHKFIILRKRSPRENREIFFAKS